ncbi:MAG: pentapeptide repeat-containing protein [Thermoleophilia bacterium]
MSKPAVAPYPPDVDQDAPGEIEFGDLVDAVVRDVDWAGRKGVGLSARRVELLRCRLTGAELAESTLGDVTFDECRVDLVGLRHAKLERVVFRDCRMGESDFSGASLKDVVFERCELRDATFSSARLERVELRGCDLAGLQGGEALRGARMPWNDVLENAVLFASLAGIEVLGEE